jgi:hypothetical protein
MDLLFENKRKSSLKLSMTVCSHLFLWRITKEERYIEANNMNIKTRDRYILNRHVTISPFKKRDRYILSIFSREEKE